MWPRVAKIAMMANSTYFFIFSDGEWEKKFKPPKNYKIQKIQKQL